MAAPLLALPGARDGASVVSATVRLPRLGAWTADVALNGPLPSGKRDLVLGDRLRLSGHVSRAQVLEGLVRARLVAGADGLRKHVKPKQYTSPVAGVVWRDLLGDVGEAPAASSDAGVLATQLQHWTTLQMPGAQAIRCLLRRVGDDVVWRHLPDGSIWAGRETWPDGGVRQFAQVGATPEDQVVEVSLLEPEIRPGTKLGDWKVDVVEMRVTGDGVRATVWTVP